MADFCAQSSADLFGEDYGDFRGLCSKGETVEVLCEDCGLSTVDEEGLCLGGEYCIHEEEL